MKLTNLKKMQEQENKILSILGKLMLNLKNASKTVLINQQSLKGAGFTVLEVITAIFILTVGVGAALSLMNQTLATASVVKQTLIASYLTQEGIEIVRNIRDTTWLEKRNNLSLVWDEYLQVGDWEVDYSSQTLTPYVGDGRFLNIESVGFYGYGPADPQAQTKFKRKITIEKPQADEIKVNIEVRWQERGKTHSFTALEYITNWYEQ